MKTEFNINIQKTVLKTTTSITPEYCYGYRSFKIDGYEFHLSYHHDRVYFNYCRTNNNGWRSGGTQVPLTNIENTIWHDYAKVIFLRDKKRGVIPDNYIFN